MEAMQQLIQLGAQLPPPTVLAACVLVLMTAVCYPYLRGRRSTVPGPVVIWPLVGETFQLALCWQGPGAFFMDRYRRYGGLYRTNLFGIKDMYCVLEPSLARTLFRGEGTSSVAPFKSIATLIGDTGHTVDGPMHTYFRKVFGTSTSPGAIEQLLPRMEELLGRCLTNLEAAGRQHIFDVGSDLAAELALEVVFGLQLQHTDRNWFKTKLLQYIAGMFIVLPINLPGFPFHGALKAKAQLLVAMERELQPQVEAIVAEDPASATNSHLVDIPGDTWRQAYERAAAAAAQPPEVVAAVLAKDRARVNALVAESMQHLSVRNRWAKGASGGVAPDSSDRGKGEVASGLIDATLEILRGQQMVSPTAAANRVLGTFTAAIDTTRNALMTIMGLLAELPEEGDKLRAEQDKLIAEHGEAITPAVLTGASYLDAFCREAVRMLPAAHVGLRVALRDLHYAGHVIPTGSYLLYDIDVLHAMDPALWDGKFGPPGSLPPHMDFRSDLRRAFQPERWLSEETRPNFMFTFASGSHLCLGMSLVYMELKVLTALMVRRGYKVSFDKPHFLQNVTIFPTLRPPRDNCHVRISRSSTAAS